MRTTAVWLLVTLSLVRTTIAQDVTMPTKPLELFNGTNFDGWTFCMKNDADPKQTWSVT